MNGGRNYDNRCSFENKSGYLLEHPWILRYRDAVTKRQVRTISRKDLERIEESSETRRQTLTPVMR